MYKTMNVHFHGIHYLHDYFTELIESNLDRNSLNGFSYTSTLNYLFCKFHYHLWVYTEKTGEWFSSLLVNKSLFLSNTSESNL